MVPYIATNLPTSRSRRTRWLSCVATWSADGLSVIKFGRSRRLIADPLASTGEARPTDIARRLRVSHVTAVKTISRLKREGMATARPYRGVFLTERGHELAARVRTRHRLVVDVLLAIGVPVEAAEADAEGIEHYVSQTTLKAFARFLRSST